MPTEHGPALPDPDEFDRQLRNITSGKAEPAKFTELSAAERARQAERARLAERAARPSARSRLSWRGVRKAKKLRKPVPEPGRAANGLARAGHTTRWQRVPTGSARPGQQSPGQRKRFLDHSGVRTTGVLAAFVLLLYGLHLLGFGPPWPSLRGSGGPAHQRATKQARQGRSAKPAFTAADPFAGSPAEQFANGATGIVLPAAHAVGGYSATQVSFAYNTAKRLLVAANLDRQTLAGGYPAAFARLLAPAQRGYFRQSLGRTGVGKNGLVKSTRGWVASFAPASTAFVGTVVKVRGYMIATPAMDSGRRVLRVHVDYLFVYPVQRPGLPVTRMRIVVQTIANADFAPWSDPAGPLQAWWFPISGGGASGVSCDVRDGFIHPAFPGSPPGKVRPTGKAVNPYRLNPPPSRAACRPTTGT